MKVDFSKYMQSPVNYPEDVKLYRFIGSGRGHGSVVPLQITITHSCFVKIRPPMCRLIDCNMIYQDFHEFYEEWEEIT